MKKILTTLTLATAVLALSACSTETVTVSSQNHDAAYRSEHFSPKEQFKTHQVAAFVVPTDQASMSFQVSGIIEQQFIKIGDTVEPGQQLFKISNPSLAPQIDQFRNQKEAIKATLEQNQAEVQRVSDLKKTNAVSQNELDRLTNQRNNLLSTKKSIEAQLSQAQSLFDETYLRAPFAGNIAEIYKEPGEVISPGEPVLVVGGVTSLEAPLYLPAFLHKNIRMGQTLAVRYADHDMSATVKEISQTANDKSQLFKIMIDVPIEHDIKSGEKITAVIQELMGTYYRLPIESVIDDGINEPFVFIVENQQVKQSRIDLVDIENNEVIVRLPQQGQIEVIISGQVNLSPNQKLSQS